MGKLHTKILIFAFALFTSLGFYSPMTENSVYTTVHSEVLSANLSASVVKVSAVSSGYNSITIAWPSVSGASGYEIHYAKGTSTKFVLLSTPSKPGFIHGSLSTNTKYNYKIRFYTLTGKKKNYSAFSTVVSASPSLSVPTNLSTTSSGTNAIKISWSPVVGASGYQVSYSSTSAGPYKNLSTVSSTSTKLNSVKPNEIVYFKIRAYRSIWFTKHYGALSAPVTGKALPAAPLLSASILNQNTIKLSWKAVPGVSGYLVYNLNTATKKFVIVADTKALTFTLSGLKTGTDVSTKVVAYTLINGTKVFGSESTVVTSKLLPQTVSGLKVVSTAVTSIALSWTAVSGASGYEITRSNSSNGTYTKIATSVTPSYTAGGLKFNTTYYFKIKALSNSGKVVVSGAFSKAIHAKTSVSAVVLTASPASSSSIKLSWTALSGVSGYDLYYSTGYRYNVFLKTVTTNNFVHTGLVTGVRVTYKIRPFVLSGKAKIYGPFSSPVTASPSSTKDELLKTTQQQLTSLIAKVSTPAEKALLTKLKVGIDRLLVDPKYNPRSDVNVAWGMYAKLTNAEKNDLIVKGTLTMNLGNVYKIKALYGL